jgi:hypothetical protein
MVKQVVNPARESTQFRLPADPSRLQDTLRLMAGHRRRVIDRRRQRLILMGAALSLVCHCMLMVYLSMVSRGGGGGGGGVRAAYQLAILNEEELTELEETTFDDLASGADLEPVAGDLPALEAIAPEPGVASAAPSSIPSLGASGDGSGGIGGSGQGGGGTGLGLGAGGGGGASFFGIGAKGSRFAYIVDVSGSMGEQHKLESALRELARSIDALPDYASFYTLFFSSGFTQPPMQKGWMKARKPVVRQFITWLNNVDPGGGTEPRTAFLQVFSLDVRPDVIFFLTDGQFNDITVEEIAALNGRGKKCVINTIQFGDPTGEALLKEIASQTGGVYRFVPPEGI